ncbi:hypothetical protein TanjilG_00196 [Lupinus angustifolius]|uniref:Uncharacterized protein n=1 Tax=Lupinus angustifolius TaxID=3871 RepID=A0A394D291_LUPAN|nr:hypothetical protein TanjilG_00196 [Lupinus angustifolius]
MAVGWLRSGFPSSALLDEGGERQGRPDHGRGGAAVSTPMLVVPEEVNDIIGCRSMFSGFQKTP